MIEFQTPDTQLAAVARQDTIQHTFLAPLSEWASAVYHYQFGSLLGKNTLIIEMPDSGAQPDFRDPDQVVGIFKNGERHYGAQFTTAILQDMAKIGYELSEIGTRVPETVMLQIQPPVTNISPLGIYVKENELSGPTEQSEMSQGMFRALSTLINLNHALLAQAPSIVLIDDIGEGLDFERSCALIKVLIEKANRHSVQLILSTNDRFVMNEVPLEYWTVFEREGSRVHVYNYHNAKKQFDEFRFTGLSNFDFFAGNFIREGLDAVH